MYAKSIQIGDEIEALVLGVISAHQTLARWESEIVEHWRRRVESHSPGAGRPFDSEALAKVLERLSHARA